ASRNPRTHFDGDGAAYSRSRGGGRTGGWPSSVRPSGVVTMRGLSGGGLGGEEFGVPAGGVEQVVVAAALQGEVVEAGGSAVEDPADVMCLAPFRGPVAAREPAVAITDHEGVEQGSGDGAGSGAVVQDAGPAGHEHAVDAGGGEQALPSGG